MARGNERSAVTDADQQMLEKRRRREGTEGRRGEGRGEDEDWQWEKLWEGRSGKGGAGVMDGRAEIEEMWSTERGRRG